MADLVGQQFGNYRLLKCLGSGSFAEVYLGKHIYLETQAAIKVTLGKLSPLQEQKFREEARNIAKLVHPNIVRFLEYGIAQNGMPYIIMDYAPQGTLENRYPHGSILASTTIVAYVKQIAAALQYVHDQKLVHRDIKPENLLVDKNGNILVSDFGIAVTAHGTGSLDTEDKIGTIHYMAPEQIRGKPRPASDQYSLGVVIYEWLCGKCPFDGNAAIEIALQHVSSPPPPFKKALNIPPQVEQVVMKALAKDPHDRFESVQEFADALEQAYQQPIVVRQPFNPPPPVKPVVPVPIPPRQPIQVRQPPQPVVGVIPPGQVQINIRDRRRGDLFGLFFVDGLVCAMFTLPPFVLGLTGVGFIVLGVMLIFLAASNIYEYRRGTLWVPNRDPLSGGSIAQASTRLVLGCPLTAAFCGAFGIVVFSGLFLGGRPLQTFDLSSLWANPITITVVIEAVLGLALAIYSAVTLPERVRRYENR